MVPELILLDHFAEKSALGLDIAREMAIVTLYEILDGRNAWHDTWFEGYEGDDDVHLSVDAAKKSVEGKRVQGSTWKIIEQPACAFRGDLHCLVVVEVNTK
jgi:hypothetical protein